MGLQNKVLIGFFVAEGFSGIAYIKYIPGLAFWRFSIRSSKLLSLSNVGYTQYLYEEGIFSSTLPVLLFPENQ